MLQTSDLILQQISEAIFLLDNEGYIRYANPHLSVITGYTSSDLLNKPLYLFYGNSDDSIKAEYELSLAQKKGKFVSEGWRTKKDKSRFWGELVCTPVYDEDNVQTGFTCLLRDLTERKQRELVLREQEERYRLMVEGVREYAIFMLDTTGHIMTWNEGAKRIKGYLKDEIIGKHFSIFYTPKDLEAKKTEWELDIAIATGRYEEIDWRVRKDGSLFWANVVITALFNAQNKLIGFSKVTRDLTERKTEEEALRQSEERYRSLVSQVRDYGIFMLDENGRIISWNEGAKNINGYTATEIIGKNFSIFYPEEDILNAKPAYELKVAREEGKYEEEGWRLRKDGSRFWANVLITPVYNTDGILIGFSKVTRDLSERKEAEKALRESYERYRMLAGELKITNSELSYANQELEQFTSIVSHDLQEPIRTIKSFLQLIDLKLNEGQYQNLKTYISKSIDAANRMRELIQNLLQYSQLAKGSLIEETITVNDLLDQVQQNLKTVIESSGADVRVECAMETVLGDRVQLAQLFQNLLSNALKFTDVETPQVTIRGWQENGYPKFAITGNGIGINKSDLSKIFEIFKRLRTNKAYTGTGIGLAICKKIAERHHGRIWTESQLGTGTTFYVTLHEEKPQVLP